ncbi:MAG: cell division protein FtsB [Deltaproteobacteria bacterium HGW-Deltaproteobacteria-6]|jgi:cell division protein FtsB|nr:MAG: cell division protein FtsB [Deltaproteobacteria bacterium HGW-Deltaproteobacteria-6]
MKIGRYLVAFLFLMTLLITFGNRGVVDNYFMGKRLSQMKAENNDLVAQNKELAEKIILLRSDLAYIESIARNELGMVKSGDVVYRLTK